MSQDRLQALAQKLAETHALILLDDKKVLVRHKITIGELKRHALTHFDQAQRLISVAQLLYEGNILKPEATLEEIMRGYASRNTPFSIQLSIREKSPQEAEAALPENTGPLKNIRLVTLNPQEQQPAEVLIESFPACLGRLDDNAVTVDLSGFNDLNISRLHAEIRRLKDHFYLYRLTPHNTLFLQQADDQPETAVEKDKQIELLGGAVLRLGKTAFQIQIQEAHA